MFRVPSGLTYLDSATYGLPPVRTLAAVRAALTEWETGTADWLEWERTGDRCRAEFAALIGAGPEEIALLPAVSIASALVASILGAGDEVLLAEDDFRSVSYPFLAARERYGFTVREAPLAALADAITPSTRLVAVSHVHSATGQLADVDSIRRRATEVGALLYLDATQSLGVLDMDVRAIGADALSCAGYKWLCTPRGVAFLYLRSDLPRDPLPFAASWRAAPRDEVQAGMYYGSPLALDDTRRRFDTSLAWHSWVGALPSLVAIRSIPPRARRELACAAVRRLAQRLDVPEPPSSILSLQVSDPAEARQSLAAAGVRASVRADRVRISSHVYNAAEDGDRAAAALSGLVGDRAAMR